MAAVAALLSIVATTSFAWPAAAASDAQLELVGDPSFMNLLSAEQALLELTNADRITNGVPALDFDPATLAIARQRAASQLAPDNLTHFDEHGLLAFVRLLQESSLPYALAGENLARSSGSESADLLPRIEQALMQSPTHRRNILDTRFSRAAIGMAVNPAGRVAFAEIFRGD
jgi:uncharacterized protein YkwD